MYRLIIIFILLGTNLSFSQTRRDYIYNYAEAAVREMENARIPASITLAQGILESRYGLSELSTTSNNHFGIKCHKGWDGGKTYYDDDAKGECFRKYNSVYESYRDHSEFLATRSRYSDLFKLSIYDYKGWAIGLRKAGYATNPNYADHLIKIIEDEQLFVFDRMSSQEVGPYIASLRGDQYNMNPVYTVQAKPNQTNKFNAKPIEPVMPNTIAEVVTPSKPTYLENNLGGPAGDEEKIAMTRKIFVENDIKTVWTFSGDTPNSIASMYGVSIDRLKKYNEWPQYLNEFTWGMKVYLQPKRSKSRETDKLYHTVQSGETMYQIAQFYGVTTDNLYKLNKMDQGRNEQPKAGQIISLRKKIKSKPLLRTKNDVISDVQIKVNPTPDPEIGHQKKEEYKAPQYQQAPLERTTPPQIKAPARVEEEPAPQYSVQSNQQQQASQNRSIVEDEDIWGQYPSTNTAQQTPKKQGSTVTNNDEYEGRAIIYEPTPPINQKPTQTYTPTNQTYSNQNTTILNPQPKQSTTKSETASPQKTGKLLHTVVSGDTLYGLSKKYNVSVTQIKEWNNMSDTTIKLGQKLIVRN